MSTVKPLILLFAIWGVAEAQIGYPGGYPPGYPGGYPGGYPPGGYPGGYPGGGVGLPIPGGRQKPQNTKTDPNQPLPNFRGSLKKMDSKTITVAMGDDRVIDFRRTGKTVFYKNGDQIKSPDFKAGDQLSVEASQEVDGSFTAVNVYWEKAASAVTKSDDKNKNDGVVDTWKDAPAKDAPASTQQSAATAQPASADDDPNRPHLKRAPADSTGDQAAASTQQSAATAQPASADDDPNRPRLRRAPTGSSENQAGSSTQQTADADSPPPPAPDDRNRPRLKRGKPTSSSDTDTDTVQPEPASQPAAATSRPPSQADAPREIASNLPPMAGQPVSLPPLERDDDIGMYARSQDPFIRKAQEAALNFTETLPNYVCQEMISRYQSESHPASWQAQDVVSMEVVYENGKEDYRNLAINGRRVSQNIEELSGAWSTGEFGTVLIDLFSPATNAQFHYNHDSRVGGITAKMYDFDVRREGSHWNIKMGGQSYVPAYTGSVWIDPATSRVLRIEMQAKGFPPEFPTDDVESATDYQYVRLGGAEQYILPVHAETLSCQRNSNFCSRNAIDFRNYHKYEGQSSITFGDVKDPNQR